MIAVKAKYYIILLLVCFFSSVGNSDIKINTTHHTKPLTTLKMSPIADDDIEEFEGDTSKKTSHTYSANQAKCLAQTIYFEARGEGYKGRVAVGNVVMNRVKSRFFPNSICGVMKERNKRMCQFSFMCNGHINKKVKPKSWARANKVAQEILSGKAPKYAKNALFFHAKYLKMRVRKNRYTAKIGQHYFYK